MTAELVEWLRQQVTEDRRLAEEAQGGCFHLDNCTGVGGDFYEVWEPDRVLAECDAKRAIINLDRHLSDVPFVGAAVLGYLALPYADRPGYRSEWAP